MQEPHWEHFSHEADMGIRGVGNSLAEAFAETALAMTAVITDPTTVRDAEAVEISCHAPEDELLLVDWLNALIYEMAVQKMLFSRFEVELQEHRLTARAWGEKIDPARHRPAVEIKGATYTCLRVDRDPSGRWLAQCVIDV